MIRRSFLKGGASLAIAAPLAGCGGAEAGQEFSAAAAEAAFPPVGRFVDAAGERVHYWEQGSGAPVVLIHGASGNLRDWTFRIAPRLAERYRVIAFDRPGFGYTTRRTEGASDPAVQAAILRAATTALGAERPIVVGHSLGGAVAMAWAVGAGAPPAGVVSVAGVALPYASTLGEISRAIGLNELITEVYQDYARSRYGDGVVREFVERVFRPQEPPEGYIAYIGAPLSLRDTSLKANAEDLSDLDAALDRISPRYGRVAVPVEAMHGTADQTVQPDQSRQLVDAVPNGRLTLLEGVGHMPHHARPDTLTAAIDRIAAG